MHSAKGFSTSGMLAAIATGIGFFLLGYGGILLSAGRDNMVAVVWPATAFGMCMVLRQSRGRTSDLVMAAAIFAGGLLANGLDRSEPFLNLAYAAINVLDVFAGVWAVRYLGWPRFRDARATARFVALAALAPPLLGAFFAALAIGLTGHSAWMAGGVHWFVANLLGFSIVFPFGMTLSWRQFAKLDLKRRMPEALAICAGVTFLSLLAFRIAAYPLHFLVLLGVLFSAVRFRILGAGLAMIVITTIALSGPDSFGGRSDLMGIELLQLFLAVASIVGVRASIVLNQRDLHLAVNERQRQRALRAARFKSQLLAHVSQEVKSPLSAIIGFSGMLESGSLPASSAREFAQVIAHNGELLQRLHDDLMDLGQAEAGLLALHPEPVPLLPSLKNCIRAIRLDASLGGKPVLLEESEDSTVHADPARLAQIINHLIANAYKYGDNHSPIRVRAARLADGFGRIEIVGAGPGIPVREQGHMFQPLAGEDHGRHVPGAGLGLTIAKLLVEKQGGRIEFQSVPGREVRFWVDLPLAA